MNEEQYRHLLDEDECPHRPNWWNQVIYYAHAVYNHGVIKLGSVEIPMPLVLTPSIQQTMCLTRDWIDYHVACPPCEIFRCSQLDVFHNHDEEE